MYPPLDVPNRGVSEDVFPDGKVQARRQSAEPVHGLVRDASVRSLPGGDEDVSEEGGPHPRLGKGGLVLELVGDVVAQVTIRVS